jgi:hypothetical protein
MKEPVATMHVYDKAKWHADGDFPNDLASSQASVHIGVFLAWLALQSLLSDELVRDYTDDIRALKSRQITGAAFLERLDGVLAADMLTDEGNAFAQAYYEGEAGLGPYFVDYADVFGADVPTVYHVPDSWDTFTRLEPRITSKFLAWRGGRAAHDRGTARR